MPNQSAPLDAARVRAHLAATRFADIRYVAHTTSTNSDAQSLLGDAAALGATIIAEFQSAGVGRKGRRWYAPAGAALLFTTILPEPIVASALWAVPFWIALAVADGVRATCAIDLEFVWPNDLHVAGGKTGGILSVARIVGPNAWVGCGVGLNVHRPAADPDLDALVPQPVFLTQLAPQVEREPLLVAVLGAFDSSFARLQDPAAIATDWATRARLAGTTYRYRNDADGIEREGVALRIGPHGQLIVRGAAGEETIDMADVRVIGRTH